MVAPNQATHSKSRGNVAKIKVDIDLLKPRLDQIWLNFTRLDGTEDGIWLDIEYDTVSIVNSKDISKCNAETKLEMKELKLKSKRL